MRKLLISLLAIFAISGVTFAQDDAAVNRSLSVYVDFFSGGLTEGPGFKDGDQSRVFKNNEYEIGATYSQNFATAQWLSIWVKALVVGGMTTINNSSGDYIGNSGGPVLLATPRAQLGLNFGGHAVIAMDTRGLIANENYYSVNLPGNGGTFTFLTILEFWAVPQVVHADLDLGGNLTGFGSGTTVVDLFALRVDYGINFAPGWRFNTKLGFRFAGGGGNDGAASTFFQDGFSVRWENQIVWSVTDSFYMWGQLRYHIANLASNKNLAVDHELYLQAGLGYSFDFSDN